MSRFDKWLLRKLIRKALVLRHQSLLFRIIWEEAKSVFYEDNVATRRWDLMTQIGQQAEMELREIKGAYYDPTHQR